MKSYTIPLIKHAPWLLIGIYACSHMVCYAAEEQKSRKRKKKPVALEESAWQKFKEIRKYADSPAFRDTQFNEQLHRRFKQAIVDQILDLVKRNSSLRQEDIPCEFGILPSVLNLTDDIATVKEFLKAGVPVNQTSTQYVIPTPLTAACYNNQLPIVRLLLEHKARIDMLGGERLWQSDALMHTLCSAKHLPITHLLLADSRMPSIINRKVVPIQYTEMRCSNTFRMYSSPCSYLTEALIKRAALYQVCSLPEKNTLHKDFTMYDISDDQYPEIIQKMLDMGASVEKREVYNAMHWDLQTLCLGYKNYTKSFDLLLPYIPDNLLQAKPIQGYSAEYRESIDTYNNTMKQHIKCALPHIDPALISFPCEDPSAVVHLPDDIIYSYAQIIGLEIKESKSDKQ